MAVERRETSRFWYARFTVNGKRVCIPLEAEVRGAPGSREFAESMGTAKAEESRLKALPIRGDAAYHRAVANALAGPPVAGAQGKGVALVKLADKWLSLPRPKKPCARWQENFRASMGRFTAFMEARGARTMAEVSPKLAEAFLATRRGEVSAGTFNSQLGALKSMFRVFGREGLVDVNPFETSARMEKRSVHRIPYSPEELVRLLEACGENIAGAVATAACTGLRRHDACTLEWRKVDLAGGWLRGIRVSKTGAEVDIPILPMLRKHLEKAKGIQDSGVRIQKADGGKYVWPEAARMATTKPNQLNYWMNHALEAAGLSRTERREGPGIRRANVRGWHSLKTTFVTMALNGGMPMEMLRKVVGNSVVDIVRKHYYQPEKERIAEELAKAMKGLGEYSGVRSQDSE